MRILLLSAYDGASHRYWREGLQEALPDHDWTVLTLPARYFSWRIRGNPLSWLHSCGDQLSCSYDLLIATSMVDIATLKGLFPALARVPTLCYFHENQFAYPQSDRQQSLLDAQMVNLYSALASDRLLFNSEFNRESFFRGADALMKRLPDLKPKSIGALLEPISAVLPVPLKCSPVSESGAKNGAPFTLVWNHRWEYDKGPERLFLALRELDKLGTEYRLHLLGESFRSYPEVFDRIYAEFSDRLLSFGFQSDRETYYRCLKDAHVVISTSIHEFQGLAVMEAAARGAVPVVPDRLSYRELFEPKFRYQSSVDDPAQEARELARQLDHCYQLWLVDELAPPERQECWFWPAAAKIYQRAFEETIRAAEAGPGMRGLR